ncbi:MAG: twin-arginine translocation signal domain-containing protein [Verrucomicrobiota bacterium]
MNLITRRTFMKTTALTIGAVALLSQGRALALEGGSSSSAPLVYGSYVTPTHVNLDAFYGGVEITIPTPNPDIGV